jgi:hypothetical protein
MSITFHYRPEENVVITVYKGDRSDDELLAAIRGMYENDLFSISMNRLSDMRQATGNGLISTSTLRQLALSASAQYKKTDAHPKVAVIAPEDTGFGLSRMYQAFTDEVPFDFAVFRAADAALAWLGLPEDFMDNLDNDTLQNAPD